MTVEFFSCAGGMAEGFRRAGIPFDLAVDAEPVHCDSYRPMLESLRARSDGVTP